MRSRTSKSISHAWVEGRAREWVVLAGITAALTLAMAAPVTAQGLSFGAQASQAEHAGYGVGPRVVVDTGPLGLKIVGSVDYFFPGQDLLREITGATGTDVPGDADYWEANANVIYRIGPPLVPVKPYIGGGLNFARTKITGTTGGTFDTEGTERGINLLAGLELGVGAISPFVEFRYEIDGGEQWVLTGGIVF